MRACTILGGPRDGDIVAHVGPRMVLPICMSPGRWYAERDEPAPMVEFREEHYYARQDYDGRWWYVREGME